MEDNELYVLFSPEFLEDIETLGNSIIVSHYYIEDCRSTLTNINLLLSDNVTVKYNRDPIPLYGYWDDNTKELKVHLSLFKNTYSNEVKETNDPDIDPEIFELESLDTSGKHNGNGLVRVFRFIYKNNKTAFVITGNINDNVENGSFTEYIIDPIICNQDKILITIGFPPTTQANIQALKEEKDTWFLEGSGVLKGINIYRTYNNTDLASRYSALSFLKTKASEIRFDKKEVPYIGNDGRNIYRRDKFRLYTRAKIYCSNLLTNIRPKTRASLNINGGILRIHGTLEYLEYEIRGTELVYIGNGSEALDGVPDSELILTTHEGGLVDPSVDGLYISYGKYEGQEDPSVLVRVRVRFYNLFTNQVEFIESENIRLTQEENVISQWEVIYRSTEYTEPTPDGDIAVYMFPWQAGYRHTFTIRTTFPNLNIDRDFSIEYADPILEEYFTLRIQKVPYREYPITDYVVSIESKIDNLDVNKWLPIINGESELKLTTVRLIEYDYTESFYFVQSPKSPEIELHDINNNNISEIFLECHQDEADFYPVAPESLEPSEIGNRNSWIVIDHDPRIEINNIYGLINPNNVLNLEHKLSIVVRDEPNSVSSIDLGKIVLGRIKESESSYNFSDLEWRSSVGLSKIVLPVQKLGVVENIHSTDTLVLEKIDLYEIRVTCNGPFACWMNESEDYCFFDPRINKPTYTNYFYSSNFNSVEGVPVYIALHNTTILDEEIFEDNEALFTVVNTEPSWNGTKPDCFDDPENLARCIIFRKKVNEPSVNYFNPKDAYVFLDPYVETEVRYTSTETPVIDRLQIIENSDLDRQLDQYNYYHNNLALNGVNILDSITPIYTTADGYRYHVQHLQNPNELFGYYPIFPSYIYRVHSYNYSDIGCPFFLFRKALGPSFYRADASTGNVIYVTANPNTETDNRRKELVIRSRYDIPTNEFVKEVYVANSFTIEAIEHYIENTNDYKHRYKITINTTATNGGGQRLLGKIIITSKIYNLINFVSSESTTIPYVEFTQSDIDNIIPPARMEMSIIQEGNGIENPDEIEVSGNRDSTISSAGETRVFTINSSVPINIPQLQDYENCTAVINGMEGFSIIVPSIIENNNNYVEYSPFIPNETSAYTAYANKKQVGLYLRITPISTDYKPYTETFSFLQNGISKGLIFAAPGEIPRLYLGSNNSINLDVSSQTTSINVFLGVFGIEEKIEEGALGTTNGININTSQSYTILKETCSYVNSAWIPTVSLQFPANTSGKAVNRNFTITYNDNGTTHKISIVINQLSGSGNILCDNNAYFASNGECLDKSSSGDLGFFRFETNINIGLLSLDIPSSLYESYNFIYIGPSDRGGGYKIYDANIKLKPNLSNSTIRNQIFSFTKNGEKIKNVWINQGYYCLRLCKPDQINLGVYNGGILGSIENPYEVPSRNNEIYASSDRKLFNFTLERSEPIPTTGEFMYDVIDFSNGSIYFPTVSNFTWTYISSQDYTNSGTNTSEFTHNTQGRSSEESSTTNNIDKDKDKVQTTSGPSIGSFLNNYNTELHEAGYVTTKTETPPPPTDLNYPFLENIYSVKPAYYSTSILFKVNVSILVDYPNDDPLCYKYHRKTTHSYTIYLLKRAE